MTNQPLKKKTILITGSAKGLGRALALHCVEEDGLVVGHFRTSKKEAEETLAALRKHNPACAMYQANLRSEEETRAMLEQILKEHNRIDVLINNVGNFIFKPIEETELSDIRDVIETNLYSSFLMTKIVAEKMKEQKSGHIINIGCAGAERMVIREKTTPYYIAKSGVIMLTKIFAHAYAKYGLNINAISPGILETSVAKLAVPAGRYASFDDIWNAVTFLLSPSSNYLNGANIEVSGGWIP
jgi:NAD(P)-dependent dehydrogenase (short-subunit alcohol dehydrogenase family)